MVNVVDSVYRGIFKDFTANMEIIPKKWAVIPFAFFQVVALSTNFYIVPQLLISKLCHKAFNSTVCGDLGHHRFKTQEDYVFNKAAEWNAMINFAGYFPATVISLPLGAMTDLVSKKKMLLLPAIASLLSSLLNLFSSIYIALPVGYLVFATFLTSLFGEMIGCITLCCTYAASTSSDDRTMVISLVMASMNAGLGIGGLAGNYFKRYLGYSSVFLFTTALLVANTLYALILIPPTDNEKPSSTEQFGLWTAFKEHTKGTWLHLVEFVKKHIIFSKNKTILLLIIVAFLTLASYGGERALIILFLKHSPLNLTADKIGIYFVLFQSVRAFGLMIMALAGKTRFRPSDYTLMFIGVIGMIINYSITSIATTARMIYISTILAFPASFIAAAVRSQLTKLVSPEEHGVSLSLVGFASVIGNLIMAVAVNPLFTATVMIYSGFSILLMSCANFVALVILCYVFFFTLKNSRNYEEIV